MPTELQIIRAREFIRVGPQGQFDLKASKAALAALARACWLRGINQALIDLRLLHPGPKPVFSPNDLSVLVNAFREVGFTHKDRLALLYKTDPHHRARLFAFIAKLRGWCVQAFDDFEEAVLWLSGAGHEDAKAEIEPTTKAKEIPVRKLTPAQAATKAASQPANRKKSNTSPKSGAIRRKTGRHRTTSARAALAILAFALMAGMARQSSAAQCVEGTFPSPAIQAE